MLVKLVKILANFIKTARKIELTELFGIPLVISILCIIFIFNNFQNAQNFQSNFNDSVISISSLLAAFGVASITILLTSSSENIKRAINTDTNRYDINKKQISYYKLLVIRSFFNLFIQMILLLISIIYKVILVKININIYLFAIQLYLVILTVYTQIFVVCSIYHLLSNEIKK
ncbi:hypothetical protein [Clostridium sp. YIM B02555]|uniref:hypothetical protein n=1 Tax=Clostridium sp. YIM B02555 TaxID=2911968 RepID=UPI001EEDEE89|nr:hypothetical protein [Clostridium sp. YIM B02555]